MKLNFRASHEVLIETLIVMQQLEWAHQRASIEMIAKILHNQNPKEDRFDIVDQFEKDKVLALAHIDKEWKKHLDIVAESHQKRSLDEGKN